MGATKDMLFSTHQNGMASLAKALAHPARIAIVEHLAKVNACICGDLVDVLPLAQPTVSQHLKELKNAGIIKGTIEGKSVCYCLDTTAFQKLKAYFTDFCCKIEDTDSSCC